jgi:hypothetical protein
MAAEQGGNEQSLDPKAKLMHEVAEQMDAIEEDVGEDFQIGRVITIVEVIQAGEEGQGQVNLRVRANMLPWVALGMLKTAEKTVGG